MEKIQYNSIFLTKKPFDWSCSILIQNINILKAHFFNEKSSFTMPFIQNCFPGTIENLTMLTLFDKHMVKLAFIVV